MPVRKTESRLPSGFVVGDIGQVATIDGVHLISFLSSPLAQLRLQNYLVFVPDSITAGKIATYTWTVTDGANNILQAATVTTIGAFEFTPMQTGIINVKVILKDAGNGQVGNTIVLQQNVVPLNVELEVLVDKQDNAMPAAAHPATSREVVNDLRMYANAMIPPASNDLYNKFILSTGYAATMATQQVQRNALLESYANLLNTGRHAEFLSVTQNGIGVCKVRPQVMAMFFWRTAAQTSIPFTELPLDNTAKKAAIANIESSFNGLSETEKIDIFNILRFPKTNYRMAKLILEGLQAKYYTSKPMEQLLAIETNVQKLLGQYETGPIKAEGLPNPTAFAKAVYNIMQQDFWKIEVLPMANGIVASPTAPSQPVFAAPEHVPEYTFIATPASDDKGFIRQAFLYHDTYGLNPRIIKSFEDLIRQLVVINKPINRIRLVSHFYLGSLGGWASCLNMPFFDPPANIPDGEEHHRYTIAGLFKFATTDDDGFESVVIDKALYVGISKLKLTINNKEIQFFDYFIKELRKKQPIVLAPFQLQGETSTPPPLLNKFLHYCCDAFILNNSAILQYQDSTNASRVKPMEDKASKALKKFFADKIKETAPALVAGTVTLQDVASLSDAIAGLSLDIDLTNYNLQVHPEYLDDHTTFRKNVATVKGFFSKNSTVDVRGCNIGFDPIFMDAVSNFFGSPGKLPKVTAPEWFQQFGFLSLTPLGAINNEAAIDKFFNTGWTTYKSSDVQREYFIWSGRLGISSHLSFWSKLAVGDAFDFLVFQWKNNIPGIALPAVKLTGFSALNFSTALQQLGEIFDIVPKLPNGTALQDFQNKILPKLVALKTVADNIAQMTAATPIAQLNTTNTALQQVKTDLAQTLPAGPITLANLVQNVAALKAYVKSQLDVGPFLTALNEKLKAPTAGIRYLMFIGLPLPVQREKKENGVLLALFDGLKDQALNSWVLGQWAEPVPAAAAIAAMPIAWAPFKYVDESTSGSQYDTLTSIGKMAQVAQLASDLVNTEIAINPAFEYQDHIISTN